MTETRKGDSQRLDELLAEFTDRVLQPFASGGTAATPITPNSEDPDLRHLQKTVLQLHTAIDSSLPDPALQRRVQARLKQEWNQQHAARQPLLRRLRDLFTPAGHPALAYAAVCLVVLLLAAVLTLLPSDVSPITGAAGRDGSAWIIVAVGLLAALGALIYFLRRRP